MIILYPYGYIASITKYVQLFIYTQKYRKNADSMRLYYSCIALLRKCMNSYSYIYLQIDNFYIEDILIFSTYSILFHPN